MHNSQLRKGTDIPYIVHPLEALVIASRITSDVNTLCAAVLHDVVEDCGVSYEELKSRFNNSIAELVISASDDKNLPWRERKEMKIKFLKTAPYKVKIIILCDKLSNLRSIKRDLEDIGDRVWEKFKGRNKSDMEWYYKEILISLEDLNWSPEYTEAEELCNNIFSNNKFI